MKTSNLFLIVLTIVSLSLFSCSEGPAEEKPTPPTPPTVPVEADTVYLDSVRVHPYSVSNLSFDIDVSEENVIAFFEENQYNRWYAVLYDPETEMTHTIAIRFWNQPDSITMSSVKFNAIYTEDQFIETEKIDSLTYVNWTTDTFDIFVEDEEYILGSRRNLAVNGNVLTISSGTENGPFTVTIDSLGSSYFKSTWTFEGESTELVFYDKGFFWIEMLAPNTGNNWISVPYLEVEKIEFTRIALVNNSVGPYPEYITGSLPWSN